MTVTWTLQTGSGAGAIQIVDLQDPQRELAARLNQLFPQTSAPLRHGWLRNAEDEPVDEILLETLNTGWRLHLHGGVATWSAVRRLLLSWGVQSPTEHPAPASALAEELLWALSRAPTDMAADFAITQFEALPQCRDPQHLLQSYDYGVSLFCPESFVLAGAPNAGKSSLLNRLAQSERAVVSPQAGTTRDLIDLPLELDGRQVRVIDGAGVRSGAVGLEQQGQDLVRTRLESARVLWVVNPYEKVPDCPGTPVGLILTHSDLGPGVPPEFAGPVASTGCGDGAEAVRELIIDLLPVPVEPPVIFTERQRTQVQLACDGSPWPPADWTGDMSFNGFTPLE